MKLRISDELSHTEEFSANSEKEFLRELNSAITCYSAHFGGRPLIGWPKLHIYYADEKCWVNAGYSSGTVVVINMSAVFRDSGNLLWSRACETQRKLREFSAFFAKGGVLDKTLELDPGARRKNFKVVDEP